MKNRVEQIKKFNADFKRLPERQHRHATRIIRPSKTLAYQITFVTDSDYRSAQQ